jgi:hypothetical protein
MARVKSQKRIGNIEYRAVVSSWNERKFIEIIRWVPNSLYGKEDEFEKSPFGSKTKNDVVYDDSCFKNPEFCYTIATIDYAHKPDIKSLGMRTFELDEQDEKDFKKLIRYAYQYAVKEFNTGNYC